MKKTRRSLLAVLAIAFVIVLALACTLGFAACGDSDEDCAHENVTWDETKTVEATCGKDGSMTGTCDDCGKEVTKTIPATGEHTYDDGVVTKNATATADGEMTYTCTVCGATKTESFTNAYLSNFVTGAYDATNPDEYYYYKDSVSQNAAYFTGSSVSVSFDGTKFIVDGTAAVMSPDQVKAFWGDGYATHVGAEYIVVTIVAQANQTITVKTEKNNTTGYTLDGSSSTVDSTFFSQFLDVTNKESGNELFTFTISNETYSVVLGTIVSADYGTTTDASDHIVTGAYDATNPDGYYYYSDSVSQNAAYFTNSAVTSVTYAANDSSDESDTSTGTYTINGTAAVMSPDQVKAFWGNGYADHVGAEYIVITFVAASTETSVNIKTEKNNTTGYTLDGSSSDVDSTFFSLFLDVSSKEPDKTLFTFTIDSATYNVVLGTIV